MDPETECNGCFANGQRVHFFWNVVSNGFYIQFRQSFAKEAFSYDEHLKS